MFGKLKLIFVLIIGITQSSAQSTEHLPACTAAAQGRHFPSGFDWWNIFLLWRNFTIIILENFCLISNSEHYWTCFNLQYTLQLCGPNPFVWFNYVQQSCSVMWGVDCEFAPVTDPPTNPPTNPPPTNPPTNPPPTVVPPEPTPPSNQPISCPSTGVSKHVNPMSCTRYWMCYDGVAVERQCSPGLYFSRAQLRCVRRDDSDCLLDLNSCPAENDPNNIVFLPDQEDCERYFVCYDGEPEEFECGPTLHWDPNNNWCIREEDSECEPSFPLPPIREIECPDDTGGDLLFLPHPEDCQFYFICLDGRSILQRCARNLLFDHIRSNCFFRDQAMCFDSDPMNNQIMNFLYWIEK